ncbi:MAG: QacE family quaternary ammonium compound efflux SMR transporter [Alphaproteobacteria bacterium]|nr:MAG: QacE family quaternary ammonium compound efflux SMR transporter [Alphaproteobacteria bacterium]
MKTYLFLALAVACETLGTTLLPATRGFSRPLPTVAVLASYAAAFWFLSLTLEVLPVSIVYAIWSGLGIALIALFGWLIWRQPLDAPAVLGMALILAGILVIQLFSATARH